MIRPLGSDDWASWNSLFGSYLRFYREVLPDGVARRTFERLCGRDDATFRLVAEMEGGGIVGIANSLVHPSTWSDSGYCYLEDLYVEESSRRAGVGRALIGRVVTEARERGASKVYWQTQEFNAPARSLYEALAKRVSPVIYELDGLACN